MPFFKNQRGEVLYHAHVPKTGGTSILKALTQKGCETFGFSSYQQPCSLQHRHSASQSLHSDTWKYKPTSFLIVLREPLERLKSAYAWQMYLCGTEASQDSFDWWLYSAKSALKNNPYTFDNHLRPQSEFYEPHHTAFKFGNWQAIEDYLGKFVGEDVTLGKENKVERPPLFIPPAHLEWFESYYAEDLKLWDELERTKRTTPCANHNLELP